MKVVDLNRLERGSSFETDVCIIGSGPAGLSIANEFIGTNTRVLVLESGGLYDEPATQALYEIENTGAPRIMGQDVLRYRILGGTSHIWTGRCAPFDGIDFEPRSWVPWSGWPVTREDLEPYFEQAGPYLGIGPNQYDETLWKRFGVDTPTPPLAGQSLRTMFWQFSKRPMSTTPMHFGRDWVNSDAPNIEILLHSNVTHINLTPGGERVESVEVSTLDGKRSLVKAQATVLCCGGIENARLLLASNRNLSRGVGNQNDMVGRFLMDHTSIVAGSFEPRNSFKLRSLFGSYWLNDERGRHRYLHGLGLSKAVQEKEQLLNCHAYIGDFVSAEANAWSALGRLKSSLKSARISGPDAKLVLGHFGEIVSGLLRRRFKHRPELGAVDSLWLELMLEQIPAPESRVTLSQDKKDALGMPLSSLHWKISDAERITARRMVNFVSDEFARLGLPPLRDIAQLEEHGQWVTRSYERAHPTGTTRMSNNPREGVVDANCQVHGVAGMFVAGSSVFPTSGAANPTLMIVATSLRLADYLKGNVVNADRVVVGATSPPLNQKRQNSKGVSSSPAILKVGLVGASRRLVDFYVPILQQLSDKYEIVGFTTFSADGFRRFESQTGFQSFRNPEELVERAKPELLVLAVPGQMNEATVMRLLDLKIPILAETPLAWTVAGTKRAIEKATANNVLLGVAEQFPFLPLEQFRKQLLSSGALGTVYVVHNDFHSYAYHGIAQLRRYLKGNPSQARCIGITYPPSPVDGLRTYWQTASVTYDDRSLLIHNFSGPDRNLQKSVRILGTLGAMHNDEIRLAQPESKKTGACSVVRTETPARHLASLSADVPGIEKMVWENPFVAYPFSDEQIGVASLLEGMYLSVRQGAPPPYSAQDFLGDIEIVQAFRFSGLREGANVALPLSERRQKVLQMTSPGYWKSRLAKQ